MERSSIVAFDKQCLWHPYTPMRQWIDDVDPLVIERAEGVYLYEKDGRSFLDANGSWWVNTLGHRHPRLLSALQTQLHSLGHVSLAGITHEPAACLARELLELVPGHNDASLANERRLARVFYSDNGSTAIEAALKMAAQYWQQNNRPTRTRFISFSGAFHGETIGATSLGGIDVFRQVFGPLLFDVLHLPAPVDPASATRALETLEQTLKNQGDSVAGVVLEPVLQGVAGMQLHDPSFVAAVRALTLTADTFLIADEVFTGFGRTGADFACDLASITPDLLCLGKALSGGLLPFAATVASQRIFDGFLGARSNAFLYGHSYCGNPLGAAVARESIAVFRDEQLTQRVRDRAPLVRACFERIANTHKNTSAPRSIGLVGAIDLATGGYLADAGWKVYEAALRRGAYLRPLGATVYIAPALTITDDELLRLLSIVEESVAEVMHSSK